MLLVSIFFDRVTAHLTHANESLNMSSPTWIVIGYSALGGVLENSGLAIYFLEDLLSLIRMKCGTSGLVNLIYPSDDVHFFPSF